MVPQVQSCQRVQDYDEVFVNEREVNAMLDIVTQETVDDRKLGGDRPPMPYSHACCSRCLTTL